MASAAPKRMTLAEFLTWDDGTETCYELVRGDVVAMAPMRARHSRIVGSSRPDMLGPRRGSAANAGF